MSLIAATGVAKNFGAGNILANISVSIEPDDRIGMVGRNGCGKTTLMRMMAGIEPVSDGVVQRARTVRIGYLPQDVPAPANVTVWQFMTDVFKDLQNMEEEINALSEKLGDPGTGPELLTRYGELQHQFESRGGYTYHNRIETVLPALGFGPAQYQQQMSHLSGGQRNRAMLAALLLEEPDILFLDEPTNHLDIEATEWLEKWLLSFKGALLIISHDRYFLDVVTNRTWEILGVGLETYRGNYSHHLIQRQERRLEMRRKWEAQQDYIKKTEEFIARNIAAMRTGVAKGRRTQLERYLKTDAIEKPPMDQRDISIRFPRTERSGDWVFRGRNLRIGYTPDKPLLEAEEVQLDRGQRVAVVGPNGIGKTTLLRTLMGELPPLAGKAEQGASLKVGYLSQTHDNLDRNATALASVHDASPGISTEQARALLGAMLLSGDEQLKPIGQLSGGQRSRVVLARLMAQHANVLVLDEPTNHLDIPSQEVLQDVLDNFEGTIVFVSHDRYLIQAMGTHLWVIENGEFKLLVGKWDDYLRYRKKLLDAPRVKFKPKAKAAPPPQVVRQKDEHRQASQQARQQSNERNRLQRRIKEIEGAIHEAENVLHGLSLQITQAGQDGDMDKVHTLGQEYQQADAKVKRLWADWTRCSEQLEKLGAAENG